MKPSFPKPLPEKATIGIVAPGSSSSRKPFDAGVSYLEKRGFRVIVPKNAKRGKFYLAGTDSLRHRSLTETINNPEVDAVICARGGYGVLRLLEYIDFNTLAGSCKPIVGYSDITALSLALYKKLGWITFSGPMVSSEMGRNIDPYTEKWLWTMLQARERPLSLQNPEGLAPQVYRQGNAEGPLLGGCMSLISPLIGTPYLPDFSGSILVLEDIDEKKHRLDRIFCHLRLAGIFEKISGLILGQFSGCFPKNPKRSFTLVQLLDRFIGDYNFPVITNIAYGHVKKRLTLPIGAPVRLTTSPPGIIIL